MQRDDATLLRDGHVMWLSACSPVALYHSSVTPEKQATKLPYCVMQCVA